MKTTYMKPQVQVVSLNMESLLASESLTKSDKTVKGSDVLGNQYDGGSLWDDEEED